MWQVQHCLMLASSALEVRCLTRFYLATVAIVAAISVSGCGVLPQGEAAPAGQTRMVLTPTEVISTGEADPLAATADVLTTRLRDAGLPDLAVTVDNGALVMAVAEEVDSQTIEPLIAPSLLRFRKVIDSTPPGSGAIQAPSPEPSSHAPDVSRDDRRTTVEATLGVDTVAAAETFVNNSITGQYSKPELDLLAPYGELSGADVAVLPVWHQYLLPTISCAQLNNRPYLSISDTDQLVVACDAAGARRWLLGRAMVTGSDVADVSVEITQSSTWTVQLEFTGAGQDKWTELTRESTENEEAAPLDPVAVGDDGSYPGPTPIACPIPGPNGNCQVAVVQNQVIVTAPEILEAMVGPAVITGDFTRDEAHVLANQLGSGPLPVALELTSLTYTD